MAEWTTPIEWEIDQLVTAEDLNEQVRGNMEHLKAAVDSIIVLQDQKAQNTSGGTFTSGAWQTRTLNTKVVDVNNQCTLSSNQFTLDAGTYEIAVFAPANRVSTHQAKLYNATDMTDVIIGTSEHIDSTVSIATHSYVNSRFTIASGKALEIQHQCGLTKATNGFGIPGNFTTEIYTTVWLRKVA